MLTRKGKYGLKALVHLAGVPEGLTAVVGDIAASNDIPKKFLDAILADLRNAGFVLSRKGKFGGYMLARPASEIMVGHVVRALDGPLAPFPCASRTQYQPCDDCDVESCQVRHMMLDVRDAIASVLDKTTLAEMQTKGSEMFDEPKGEPTKSRSRRAAPAKVELVEQGRGTADLRAVLPEPVPNAD